MHVLQTNGCYSFLHKLMFDLKYLIDYKAHDHAATNSKDKTDRALTHMLQTSDLKTGTIHILTIALDKQTGTSLILPKYCTV